MATVPNQKIITFAKKRPWDKDNPFARLHVDAMQNARKNLKAEAFVLWLAISSWDENSTLELSCQYMMKYWGFAERSYHRARNELLEKGYLALSPTNKGMLIFYEDGTANLAVGTKNGDQTANLAVSTKPTPVSSAQVLPYENNDQSANLAASSKKMKTITKIKNHEFSANLAAGAELVNINDNKTHGKDIFGQTAKMAAGPCQNGSIDCQIGKRNTTETTDKIKEEKKQNNNPIKLTRDETNELLENLRFEKDYKIQNGIITIFETNKTYLLPQI